MHTPHILRRHFNATAVYVGRGREPDADPAKPIPAFEDPLVCGHGTVKLYAVDGVHHCNCLVCGSIWKFIPDPPTREIIIAAAQAEPETET